MKTIHFFAARLIVEYRAVLSEFSAERVVPRNWSGATLEGCVQALLAQWSRPESAARRLSIELTLKLIPSLPALQLARANEKSVAGTRVHTRIRVYSYNSLCAKYL